MNFSRGDEEKKLITKNNLLAERVEVVAQVQNMNIKAMSMKERKDASNVRGTEAKITNEVRTKG